MKMVLSTLAIWGAAAALPAAAQAPGTAPNYRSGDSWLCRPGRTDACTVNQDATLVTPAGVQTVERFKPATAPKFDCFYVYPTVSTDTGANSDMIADPAEKQVVQAQAARFRANCRVFAPMYRQVTLNALRQSIVAGKPMGNRALAYEDVRAAWNDYLARDNKGRGVVLIGHSQGSGILKQLIASEIDGLPIQRRLIAAYLAGTNVAVPPGKDTGGDFRNVRLCRSADQTGCVVAWVSFRADSPPPKGSRFGTVAAAPAACVNAAALGGGKAVSRPIFTTAGAGLSSKPQASWASGAATISTQFVSTPGLISTECVSQDGFGYLAVTVNADPADTRTDTVEGDVMVGNMMLKDWGLHLLDMPVVMGDLVALSEKQAEAWAKRK